MKIMTQLAFGGQCREAFEHYERVLGGKITVMNSFGDNADHELPPGSTSGPPETIRFAEIRVGDQAILGNDVPPDQYQPMRGFSVALHTHNECEAERIFAGLAEGGAVEAPLSKVDWARLFGMVTDRFGVPWLILALDE